MCGSGSVFRIRIRIQEAPEYGSNTDPDPQHWGVRRHRCIKYLEKGRILVCKLFGKPGRVGNINCIWKRGNISVSVAHKRREYQCTYQWKRGRQENINVPMCQRLAARIENSCQIGGLVPSELCCGAGPDLSRVFFSWSRSRYFGSAPAPFFGK